MGRESLRSGEKEDGTGLAPAERREAKGFYQQLAGVKVCGHV
jgi:hypothetical protein